MNSLKISIITITYNDLEGLKKTIDSIDRNFNFSNSYINHIIVDGDSIDGTPAFINNIMGTRRINTQFISESDLGIYDAMNKGVNYSSSDYVVFINSGDLVRADFFDLIIYNRLLYIKDITNYAGLALGCIYNFNGIKLFIKSRDVSVQSPRMPTMHQGIIYKRSVLLDIPYSLKFRICGDFDNICSIIKKHQFDYIDVTISELCAGGVSTTKPLLLAKESYLIFVTCATPSIFNKLLYVFRLFTSLLIVQFLYYLSKIFPHKLI